MGLAWDTIIQTTRLISLLMVRSRRYEEVTKPPANARIKCPIGMLVRALGIKDLGNGCPTPVDILFHCFRWSVDKENAA